MGDDPRSYFRTEARELVDGLVQGALELERTGTLTPGQRKHLLRLAHTLKGAARIVKESAIAETAHAIEGLIAEAADRPEASLAARLLAELDAVSRQIPTEPPPGPPGAPPPDAPPADEPARTVRVDLPAIDGLLHRIIQIGAGCADLRDQLEERRDELPSSARRMIAAADGLTADVAQLREEVRRMRLTPASILFVTLERAVRDAARAAGVQARLVTDGGDERLDGDVLANVRDALIQLVRNAVAHGIEPPAARAAAGKPADGTIALSIERRGASIAFVCRDDGRGLDLDALRRAAERSAPRTAPGGETLSEQQIVERLLAGGMTSSPAASQLAGRGVGLNLVQSVAARLNGRVSLSSTPGAGVTAELVVPVSIRSLSALRLEAGGRSALVPLDAVRGATRLTGAPAAAANGRRQIVIDGRALDVLRLDAILGGGDRQEELRGLAVLVDAGESTVAIAADRLGEVETVVVQGLPPLSGASAVVRGLAVDDRGGILPVLEPMELPALSRQHAVPAAPPPEHRRPRVLIVDDSITTRMLEQSILQAAGYAVDAAISGEDALARASRVPYDLFIVDVEMPGMSGFEFLDYARQTAGLADVPAILVTSRSSEEDRRRGADAGARAFIVKSEFDQELFLRTIRGLVG